VISEDQLWDERISGLSEKSQHLWSVAAWKSEVMEGVVLGLFTVISEHICFLLLVFLFLHFLVVGSVW